MPRLTERRQRQPEDIGRTVVGVKPARTEMVAYGIDAPGHVVNKEDSPSSRAAPWSPGSRLAPLDFPTVKARASECGKTALAYVRHGGNSVEMAAALHVHPQTARYRVARLRDQLDDPD